ncbi:MAG: DNA replication protein [Rhodospirillales bacterium]|nr:DNA replication protein [Rhodospirillales bacterium]
MTKPVQIPLDLGHRNAMGREDFMIAAGNQAAVAWIDRWPDWPAPALVIYGPPACGKTHLGAVWQARSPACAGRFIDDVQDWIGHPAREEELFHRYNLAKEDGTSLLLAAETPPQSWPFVLPDLASRLRAVPCVEILPPDESFLAVLLVKLFHDRQLPISTEVVQYILPRIERSTAAVRHLVERADRESLSGQRAVTVPLISRLLQDRAKSVWGESGASDEA